MALLNDDLPCSAGDHQTAAFEDQRLSKDTLTLFLENKNS